MRSHLLFNPLPIPKFRMNTNESSCSFVLFSGKMHMTPAFLSSPSFVLGRLTRTHQAHDSRHARFRTNFSNCTSNSRRLRVPKMVFVDPIQTLPELVNHIIVSCGIGLAGIVGAKATEEVRALTSGDRRADYFDALARDVDSVRRRQELSAQAGDRDWNDVAVDKFSNILVVPEEVPEIESYDDLRAFDRVLHESPAPNQERHLRGISATCGHHLPDASEFELEEDDRER